MTRKVRQTTHVFQLFVTGTSPRASRTLKCLRAYCEQYFAGAYRLDVIDIYLRPKLARDADIVATPTLIKLKPLPMRRFVGDLSEAETLFGRALPRPVP